ncbi:hypothetical protein I4U23_005551 [Adineta vaga]|nr:hypothetical protein I4U23_005551 [Adineta vaga]
MLLFCLFVYKSNKDLNYRQSGIKRDQYGLLKDLFPNIVSFNSKIGIEADLQDLFQIIFNIDSKKIFPSVSVHNFYEYLTESLSVYCGLLS